MDRKQNLYKMIMVILITAIISLLVSTIFIYNYVKQNPSTRYVFVGTENNTNLQQAILAIRDLIDEYYLGEVPTDNDLIEGAVKGYVAALGDEFTEYMTTSEWQEYQEEALGNYTGLGVYMRGVEKGQQIVAILKDSPAEKHEIQVGDIFTKVGDIVCTEENGEEVTNFIKSGEIGTNFIVEILRGNETITKEITREMVRAIQVESEVIDNIGYINISTFDRACAEDFKTHCQDLVAKGVTGLIIDLRNNTGGVMTETLDIAEMFLNNGDKMLITHDKENGEVVYTSETKMQFDLPIVVLVNEYSASASEILVAALKDNNRATILGTKTYGKGILQDVLSLSNGAALKITTREFIRPNGEKIHEVGIEPDIVLEIPEEYPNIAYVPREEDNQLKKAIEILKAHAQ